MFANRFFRTIQWKLIIMYVLLILLAMQLIGIYFVRTMESSFMQNFTESLNDQAGLLAGWVEEPLSAGQDSKNTDGRSQEERKGYPELDQIMINWFKVSNADVQIIDANGIVLSASQANAAEIVNQKNTQTIVSRALQNIKDRDNELIIMDTDGKRKKVIAKPVGSGGKVIGAVYIVASLEEIYDTINRINGIFLSGTIIALTLTAVLCIILSHTITSPIKEITKQVASVAEGSLDRRVKVLGQDEIGQLSQAFNEMTDRLKEALSLNEEEKEKLASILTNMSDGVIATDDRGRVIVLNRRAKHMLQLKEEESIGRYLFDILGMPKVMAAPHVLEEEMTTMIDVPRDDDELLKVKVTFTPILRREIRATGTIVVLQDVTEQEKLDQSRQEFVANVSHELRTPLTTIKSYLEALEDGALEDPQLAQRFVGVTRNETERMIRLVTDLLQLSRFDSNKSQLKKELTDVRDMLEEVADRFSFQLQQTQSEITIQVSPGIKEIMVDRDKIDQVLDNLVSNAIKYSLTKGKIDIQVKLVAPEWLEVTVRDNGIGIPKKDLSRIFDRFYRVDKARSRNMGGTGLGLSIAREMIKAHGGTISLQSEISKGTMVSFTLPYQTEGGAHPTWKK